MTNVFDIGLLASTFVLSEIIWSRKHLNGLAPYILHSSPNKVLINDLYQLRRHSGAGRYEILKQGAEFGVHKMVSVRLWLLKKYTLSFR